MSNSNQGIDQNLTAIRNHTSEEDTETETEKTKTKPNNTHQNSVSLIQREALLHSATTLTNKNTKQVINPCAKNTNGVTEIIQNRFPGN